MALALLNEYAISQSHWGELAFEMLLYANSSEDTIVVKTLRMCLDGDLHFYCNSGGLVVCFEEKTYVEKLEMFDGNGNSHQFLYIDMKVLFWLAPRPWLILRSSVVAP